MVTVDVVIVNWNAGDLLRRTVEALARSKRKTYRFGRLTIVDNASTDDSLAQVNDWANGKAQRRTPTHESGDSLPLTVVKNESNIGFAAACNQGAANSTADYLLFLNPDVEVEPDTLDQSVASLQDRPQSGILGAQLVDEARDPQLSCARFPTPTRFLWKALGLDRIAPKIFQPHYLTDFDHRSSRDVDQVMGAYYFVRRDLYNALGGFDERFFVYFEEVDFSLRARKQGWTTHFCAEAHAYHVGEGTTEQIKAKRLFYSLRSRLAFAVKHFRPGGVAVLLLGTVLVELPVRVIRSLLKISLRGAIDTVSGYVLFCRDVPLILRRSS